MLPEGFIADGCWHDTTAVFLCTSSFPSDSEPMLNFILDYDLCGDLDIDGITVQQIPTPLLAYTPDSSTQFGTVYLGDTSAACPVILHSVGTNVVNITGISWQNDSGMFIIDPSTWTETINPGDSLRLSVTFVPTRVGTFSDTLVITSNANNYPVIRLFFSGTGQYVPPAIPQNLLIQTVGHDARLSWDPVSTTIYGTPITPDVYVVEYSENAGGPFYYLNFVGNAVTTFTHTGVLLYGNSGNPANHMFYRVKAVKSYRSNITEQLSHFHTSGQLTWDEVSKSLETR
jgi:hypothetical protein